MEGCAVFSSHVKIHTHRNCVSTGCFLPCRQSLRSQRNTRVAQLLSLNHTRASPLLFANPKENPCPRLRSIRFYCVGTLINTDVASTFEWVPVVDQVLLMASVLLAHMAGVIPARKSNLSTQNQNLNDDTISGDSTVPGSTAVKHEKVNLEAPWDMVEEKLMDALSAIEQGGNSVNKNVNLEQKNAGRPLSLCAVAEGPRVRLLWASFWCLKQQVDNISGTGVIVNTSNWCTVMSEIFQKSCKPVFVAWMKKELGLKREKFDKDFPAVLLDKLMGDDSISLNIRNSGKEDLYAELTQFPIFGSLR